MKKGGGEKLISLGASQHFKIMHILGRVIRICKHKFKVENIVPELRLWDKLNALEI